MEELGCWVKKSVLYYAVVKLLRQSQLLPRLLGSDFLKRCEGKCG